MSNKVKQEKTPMQKALGNIKVAYIAAFISAAITFIVAIASLWVELFVGLDIFALIDVVIIFFLAILLVTIKSRVASIILFVLHLFSQIVLHVNNPNLSVWNILQALGFLCFYLQGILGTFAYHKLRKQETQAEVTDDTDRIDSFSRWDN